MDEIEERLTKLRAAIDPRGTDAESINYLTLKALYSIADKVEELWKKIDRLETITRHLP